MISPTKQVFSFQGLEYWNIVAAMLTIKASEKLGREGMVEWNRIFQLFLFSGILSQAREVHRKFRNEVPENVLSIRSSAGISGSFGRMESAYALGAVLISCLFAQVYPIPDQ